MVNLGLFAACFPDNPAPTARAGSAGFADREELARHCLRAGVVVDIPGLEAIADEWQALERRDAGPPIPFNRYNWVHRIAACYTTSGQRRLRVVTVREHGRLALVLPLMTETTAAGIVIGRWLGSPLSKYGDCLAADTLNVNAAVEAALAEIRRWRTVDALLLRNVRADAVCAPAVRRAASVVNTRAAPFLDLTGYADIDAFRAAAIGASDRTASQMDAAGRVTLEVAPSGPDGAGLMRQAIAFETARLGDRGSACRLFSDDASKAALIDLAAHPDSGLMISTLRLHGEIIAIEAGYRCSDQYCAFLTATSPDAVEIDPRALQIEAMVGWCLDQGLARLDLLAPASEDEARIATGSAEVSDCALPLTLLGRSYVGFYLNGLRAFFGRGSA